VGEELKVVVVVVAATVVAVVVVVAIVGGVGVGVELCNLFGRRVVGRTAGDQSEK